MGAYYVDLDVHSRDTVFVIQDETGAIIGRGTVPTAPGAFARVCQQYELLLEPRSRWRREPRPSMWRVRGRRSA